MYNTMRRLIALLLILGSAAVALSQPQHQVLMRSNRQDQTVRIVLETDDEMVRNLRTTSSFTSIRIDFPSPFTLTKQNESFFDMTQKDGTLLIALKNAAEVRAFKLADPPRLVLEVRTSEPARAEPPRPEMKTVPVPEPKTPAAPAAQTVRPVPAPASPEKKPVPADQPATPRRSLSIAIDPGHGGYDYGLIRDSIKEKDAVLAISRDLSLGLAKQGHKVLVTRKADQAMTLPDRIQTSTARKADVFISIHLTPSDRFAVTTARFDETQEEAFERLYALEGRQRRYLAQSRALAKAVAEALKTEFKAEVKSRELPLPVLTASNSAAVLIECPLLVQPGDPKVQARLIGALLRGIETYAQ